MVTPNLLYRSAVLGIAHNRAVKHLVMTRGRSFASRFVAGETVHDALDAIDGLEQDGIHGILDLLGEMTTSLQDAEKFTVAIKKQIEAFATRPYPRYVSIKLSQIGLNLNKTNTLDATRQIVRWAQEHDCFLRIDMEDSPRVERTIEVYRILRREGYNNLGLVLQSYLRRTAGDIEDLLPLSPNLRIVKGAYSEPREVAFQDKLTVNAAYLDLVRCNLKAGNCTAIATHDERIIDATKEWIREQAIDPSLVEYQMLYGIRRDLQRALAAQGYRIRAYVPFGTEWYSYFSRRIAESPKNALFVTKAIVGR